MKLILNIFKSLAVLYWVLAASLFITMVFFPGAIDTLHNGYNEFAGLVAQPSSSEVVDSSLTEESSSSEEVSSEVVDSSEELSSEEVTSSSEDSITSEETTSEEVTSSEDSSSSEELPSSEPAGRRFSNPVEEDEDEVVCLALECEEETPVLELTALTREEFVSALESILVYSALGMLPFTILVFTISSKLSDYSKEEETEEVVEEETTVLEPKEKKQSSKKVKEESIGLTGLKIRK
jgi:hypothetical protein